MPLPSKDFAEQTAKSLVVYHNYSGDRAIMSVQEYAWLVKDAYLQYAKGVDSEQAMRARARHVAN